MVVLVAVTMVAMALVVYGSPPSSDCVTTDAAANYFYDHRTILTQLIADLLHRTTPDRGVPARNEQVVQSTDVQGGCASSSGHWTVLRAC